MVSFNTKTINTIRFISVVLVFFFTYLLIKFDPINGLEGYISFSFRISFLLLTFIVTLTIFANNLRTKLSAALVYNARGILLMSFGVIFTLAFLVSTLYISNKITVQNNNSTIDLLESTSFLLQKSLLIFVFLIFSRILYNFITSFIIEFNLVKQQRKIRKYIEFPKFFLNGREQILSTIMNSLPDFDKKNKDNLENAIEVYIQNLIFLSQNKNEKILKKYLLEWDTIFVKINHLLYYSYSNMEMEERKQLLSFLLKSNTNLIEALSGKHDLKNFSLDVINWQINSVQLNTFYQKDEFKMYQQNYKNNFIQLIDIYFDEISETILKLYKGNIKEIFQLFANGELVLLTKYNRTAIQYTLDDNVDMLHQKVDNLLLICLFTCIEDGKSEDISTVVSLLLSLQNKDFELNSNSQKINLSIKKEVLNKVNKQDVIKISFSRYLVEHWLIAIIKSTELENYKSTGYLIKILENFVKYEIIEEALKKLFEEFNLNQKGIYSLNKKFNINPHSSIYCFKKSVLLINLQYYMRNETIFKITLKLLFNDDLDYHFKKFEMKYKEYNLVSLHDDNKDNFKKTFGFYKHLV